MLLRPTTLLAAAGMATVSQAFLLPPGALSDAPATDEPAFKALPFEVAKSTESQTVKLDCPGCPIVIKGQTGSFRMRHGSSHLDLDFTVEHAPEGDRLLVNGFELYPTSDPTASALRAPVIPAFDGVDENMPGSRLAKSLAIADQDLGFSLMVRPVKADEDSGSELISVDLQVIEVGNRFIQGLKSIHLDLLKQQGGALMMTKIHELESQNPATAPGAHGQCTTMACRLSAMINSYAGRLKPHCPGMMGQQGMPHGMAHGHGHGSNMPMGGHHHGANAGHIQYHHTHRSWARLFKKFSYTILLPILVGIVAGISVSIIGMVVGTLIVGLWRVFVRGQTFFPRRCHRRRSGSTSHKAPEQDAALAEEKSGLMADQEAPPSYTDEENKPTDA